MTETLTPDGWSRVVGHLADDTARPHHKAWIGLTQLLGTVEDTALLAAPNEFAKDYLENQLRPLITSALSAEVGREIRVAVTVQSVEQLDTDATDPAHLADLQHRIVEREGDPLPTDVMLDDADLTVAVGRLLLDNGVDVPIDALAFHVQEMFAAATQFEHERLGSD